MRHHVAARPRWPTHVPDRGRLAGRPAARRRRDPVRQDQPADLRRRHPELQRGLRHDQQPVRHHAHAGRLVGRVGGGAGDAVHADRARLATSAARSGCRRTMSGVMGHKPSYGIVPAHGQIPGPPGTLTQADIAVAGPMARTVADLELDSTCSPAPTAGTRRRGGSSCRRAGRSTSRDFRIAAWTDDPSCPVDTDTSRAARRSRRCRRRRREAGSTSMPVRHSRSNTCGACSRHCCSQRSPTGTLPRRSTAWPPTPTSRRVERSSRATAMRHQDWLSAHERRLQLREQVARFFDGYDAILMPVHPRVGVPARPSRHAGDARRS